MAAYTLVVTTWPNGQTSTIRHDYRDLAVEQLRRWYTATLLHNERLDGDTLVRRRRLHTMTCTGAHECPWGVDRVTFHESED